MFDHVGIHVGSLAASERFYTTVLGALGIEQVVGAGVYREWDDFAIGQAMPDRPVTRNVHLGFAAPSREAVGAFWQAGVDAGYASDGAPGPRSYTDTYFGAFLLDPDGNSVEAVHRDGLRSDGHVDHVWIRVGDVRAAGAFYATVAPHAGIRQTRDEESRVAFVRAGPGGGAFSAVADGRPLTTGLHLAFLAPDTATVDAFHAAAMAAGYRDNGAPGERPEYHPGYYGAFVFDPAGTNVESVHHARG